MQMATYVYILKLSSHRETRNLVNGTVIMLAKEDVQRQKKPGDLLKSNRPPHCDDFKECLVKALKILEERYKV